MIHQTIKEAINKVNSGHFDSYLQELDGTNLGIFINAYVDNKKILPIPDGLHQAESELQISLSNSIGNTDIQVGWFGQNQTICSNHPSCEDYKHGPKKPIEDPLEEARELSISLVHKMVSNYRTMIDKLFADGMGLFMIHGHSSKFSFTELPSELVAVIENNRTYFRPMKEIINLPSFTPNIWRMKDGVRQIAGGFIV